MPDLLAGWPLASPVPPPSQPAGLRLVRQEPDVPGPAEGADANADSVDGEPVDIREAEGVQ